MKLKTIFKTEIKSIIFLFAITSLQAQCKFDFDVKTFITEMGLEYHQPDNYFCIEPPSSYFSIHPDYNLGTSLIGMINNDNEIMISIFSMPYPKGATRAERYLIATVDLNNNAKKTSEAEIDSTLTKAMEINSSHLKKLNADRGIIYNIKVKNLYLGIYPRCKKIEIYKDNIGRSEILFFYKENQEKIVNEEIEKTWGMLRFKS